MRASRILAFARTTRPASVEAAIRKARAISSVVSPHTSRNVKANRASGANSGWQQMKIKRNWSSSTPSLSDTVTLLVIVLSINAILSSEASNRARRRSESIASRSHIGNEPGAGVVWRAVSSSNVRVRPQTHPASRPRQDRNRPVNGSAWREYGSTPHDKRGRPIRVSVFTGSRHAKNQPRSDFSAIRLFGFW